MDCADIRTEGDERVSTDGADGTTANDLGGAEDMLSPMEATDSDEVRNADGDEVVDPPEDWVAADKFGMSADEEREGETLDQRLAEEVPDVTPDDVDPRDADATVDLVADPGQIDGTPEDGDSLYPV